MDCQAIAASARPASASSGATTDARTHLFVVRAAASLPRQPLHEEVRLAVPYRNQCRHLFKLFGLGPAVTF